MISTNEHDDCPVCRALGEDPPRGGSPAFSVTPLDKSKLEAIGAAFRELAQRPGALIGGQPEFLERIGVTPTFDINDPPKLEPELPCWCESGERFVDCACGLYGRITEAEAELEAELREARKLGRNQPCWCGSGKKFKRCHKAA